MYISINNTQIDKTEILSLIQSQRKIAAIKRIREQLQIGLRESKDIVDNLDQDPTYYDGKNHTIDIIPSELFNDSNKIKTSRTIKRGKKQKNLFIERSKTNTKTYIIIFLAICIAILGYFYSIK
jgi:hypothetical protein